jgi:hypothetical protein
MLRVAFSDSLGKSMIQSMKGLKGRLKWVVEELGWRKLAI